MTYFSRLSDIVTCNLTEMLARESDPRKALRQILSEMEEGLGGASRSVATARNSEARLSQELAEHRSQIDYWTGKAKEELQAGREQQARAALSRKQEVYDVVAGLVLQHQAAVATIEHLTTTQRALEARVADARRRLRRLEAGGRMDVAELEMADTISDEAIVSAHSDRTSQIDAELEALKRELEL